MAVRMNTMLAVQAIQYMVTNHGTDHQREILEDVFENLDDEELINFAEAVFNLVLDKGLSDDLGEVLEIVYGDDTEASNDYLLDLEVELSTKEG